MLRRTIRAAEERRGAGIGYAAGMSGPEMDRATAESKLEEADFADEHTKATHADEHPSGADVETDESTPDGHAGMDG
ncbi:hypothetical protein NBRGN_110_00350 [Nocardia brasiliensis NBRC 14402]|nr:hypothetical protein NBRGN_110_00350 [Nocardia brasiliensis NBRC 14402]